MSMRFGILGPLAVTDDSRSISIRAAKPRALLAVLLSCANTTVSVDRLLAALWGDTVPRTAVDNVRLYVHRLRQALREHDRIAHCPPGYALRVQPGELDVVRFEDLARCGQEAMAAADP